MIFLQYQTRGFLSMFNLLAEHLSQLVPPGPIVTLITWPHAIQQTHPVYRSHASPHSIDSYWFRSQRRPRSVAPFLLNPALCWFCPSIPELASWGQRLALAWKKWE